MRCRLALGLGGDVGKDCVLTYRDPDGADHHAHETIFGVGFATFGHHTRSVVLLQLWSHEQCQAEADPDRDESKANTAVIPTIIATEDNRITEEEGVLCGPIRMYDGMERRCQLTRRP